MDRLWAPWRIGYINKTVKKAKGCIFCRSLKKSPKNNQVVFETRYSRVMLNIFPYNNGHLLVSPKRHTADIDSLSDAEAKDLFCAIKKAKRLLQITLKPQGYNIGMNISSSAGAGITDHIHVHIVPRWLGDTNFMPVMHATKIISQSLDELLGLLKNAQKKQSK